MTMSFDDIIELGLAKEKEAAKFYRYWADRLKTTDELWSRGKTMMLSLATEEEKHQQVFEKLKKANLSMKAQGNETQINAEDYASGEDLPSDAGTKDVIAEAIRREEQAMRFYGELAKLGGDMRGVFSNLADQESKHKERLEAFLKEHVLVWD